MVHRDQAPAECAQLMMAANKVDVIAAAVGQLVVQLRDLSADVRKNEADNKRLSDQLADALDGIYELKVKLREREEMVEELRTVNSRKASQR